MDKVKLSSPWITYAKNIIALFDLDPEVKVSFNSDTPELKLYVEDKEKADALTKLLPTEKTFGNVTLKIEVIPANVTAESKASLFRKAFKNNPAVEDITTIDVGSSNTFTYISFQKTVVQYYNDDLSDPHGLRSTLYQEIAREVFKDTSGVYFCTSR